MIRLALLAIMANNGSKRTRSIADEEDAELERYMRFIHYCLVMIGYKLSAYLTIILWPLYPSDSIMIV